MPQTLADRQSELVGHIQGGSPSMGIPGWPPRSAFAAAGNATQESKCTPVTVGRKDHGSDGLFQWRLDRLDGQRGLKAWAQRNGLPWNTIKTQAWFFMWEMQADYPALYADLLAGNKSLATLTANICRIYERPAAAEYSEVVNGRTRLEWRIKYANDVQGMMATTVPAPKGPIVAAGGLGAAGGIVQFLLENPQAAVILIGFAVAIGGGALKLMFDGSRQAPAPDQPHPAEPSLPVPISRFERLRGLIAERQEIDKKIADVAGEIKAEATEAENLLASIQMPAIEHQPEPERQPQ